MSDRNPKSIADLQMTIEEKKEMMQVICLVIQSRAAKPVVPHYNGNKGLYDQFCYTLIRSIQLKQEALNPTYPRGTIGCIANAQNVTHFISDEMAKGNFGFSGPIPVEGQCRKALPGYVNITGDMIWQLQLYWHALTTCNIEDLLSDLSEGKEFNLQKMPIDVPTYVMADQRVSRELFPSCHRQLMMLLALITREITPDEWRAVRNGLEKMHHHENPDVKLVTRVALNLLPTPQ